MGPNKLLAEARKNEDHTQESLAQAIREKYPRARTSADSISKMERARDWRPRDRTWRRLRAVLPSLPFSPA